jgi:hypothetical protein
MGPPSFFMLSEPQSTSATVSGSALPNWRGVSSSAGLAQPIAHREGAGQAEGVEAVEVAPRRQHIGGAQQVAARGRCHEAAVQGMHQRIELRLWCSFWRCRAGGRSPAAALAESGQSGSSAVQQGAESARRRAASGLRLGSGSDPWLEAATAASISCLLLRSGPRRPRAGRRESAFPPARAGRDAGLRLPPTLLGSRPAPRRTDRGRALAPGSWPRARRGWSRLRRPVPASALSSLSVPAGPCTDPRG